MARSWMELNLDPTISDIRNPAVVVVVAVEVIDVGCLWWIVKVMFVMPLK